MFAAAESVALSWLRGIVLSLQSGIRKWSGKEAWGNLNSSREHSKQLFHGAAKHTYAKLVICIYCIWTDFPSSP